MYMPRTRTPQQKRQTILEAAKGLLTHTDYNGLSIEAIAREAGISKATFYAYFESKEKLRKALLAEGLDETLLSPRDNRAAILEAALKTFAERGFHATTLEDIADAAGITKGTIYWYFKTKESLLSAIAERYSIFPDLNQLAVRAVEGDDEKQLAAIANKLLATAEEHVNVLRMAICEAQHFPEVRDLMAQEILGKIYPLFGQYLQRRIEAGVFRPVNPVLITQTFVSTLVMFALARHTLAEQFPFSREEMVREFVHLFLDGIRKK